MKSELQNVAKRWAMHDNGQNYVVQRINKYTFGIRHKRFKGMHISNRGGMIKGLVGQRSRSLR